MNDAGSAGAYSQYSAKLTAKDVSVVDLLAPTESHCEVCSGISVKASLILAGSASLQHNSISQMHTAPQPTTRCLALPPRFLTI